MLKNYSSRKKKVLCLKVIHQEKKVLCLKVIHQEKKKYYA